MIDINHFEFFTSSFILANLASEVIKMLAQKIFVKVDSMINSPLDLD